MVSCFYFIIYLVRAELKV